MRILIAGMDGYLGWPLAMYLTHRGHEVAGIDVFLRRAMVAEMGGDSATPILPMPERLAAFEEAFGRRIRFVPGDLRDFDTVSRVLYEFRPEAIVHLGEQPSAPYSMSTRQRAVFTQMNNVEGTLNLLFAMRETCRDSHLVKLGTMGEYGTPNVPIPEGFFTIEYRGRTDTLPFPRQAGSWYHQSKVHDSNNITLACRIWGLRSTDLMQGVVYGSRTEETSADARLCTRFDFDEAFGTAVNRFCAQAVIGHPLTPYGKGNQKRGFINIVDSMRCMELAILNAPTAGEYRVFNQFTETFSVNELATAVQAAAERAGIATEVVHPANPRMESEDHFYEADHQRLLDLGLAPHSMSDALEGMIGDLVSHKARIQARREAIFPKTRWRGFEDAVPDHGRMRVHRCQPEPTPREAGMPTPGSR